MALKNGSLNCKTMPTIANYKHTGTWEVKLWKDLTSFYTSSLWSDGRNIYHSDGADQYVLNGDTWEPKTWNGLSQPRGWSIWTDGINIYHSYNEEQYVLNGDTWEDKTWNGIVPSSTNFIWTDGTNIYYSSGADNCVLNGDTWEPKTWNGHTSINGRYVWSDGTNIFYMCRGEQYVLNGNTWTQKTWNVDNLYYGDYVWSDGTNIYYSHSYIGSQYVLDGSTWKSKEWGSLVPESGSNVWTDGKNIYYSITDKQYVLAPVKTRNYSEMLLGYQVGQAIRRMRGAAKYETLWEGEVTTEAVTTEAIYAGVGEPTTAAQFQSGDTIALTVDGVRKTFVAESTTSNGAVAGNVYLYGSTSEDIGYDYYVSTSPIFGWHMFFGSRNPGSQLDY